MLTKKKDGGDRFCVDFRKLNSVTRKDAYPMPNFSEILDHLDGASFFSSLDLYSGYWKIDLERESKECTACICDEGLYQFKKLPFGLCNAPVTFQRFMEMILRGLQWQYALIYLDDILVFGKTIEEHNERLALVFDRFREQNVKLKVSKYYFAQRQVEFLGHMVNDRGVSPNDNKIKIVKEYPTPKNAKEIKIFLGLAGYYRKFVKNFAGLFSPLTALLRKNSRFVWTKTCQTSFDLLKEALTNAPILAFPDFNKPFHLHVDASDNAVGLVLEQEYEMNTNRVVAYGGRSLTLATLLLRKNA